MRILNITQTLYSYDMFTNDYLISSCSKIISCGNSYFQLKGINMHLQQDAAIGWPHMSGPEVSRMRILTLFT